MFLWGLREFVRYLKFSHKPPVNVVFYKEIPAVKKSRHMSVTATHQNKMFPHSNKPLVWKTQFACLHGRNSLDLLQIV
jgi:hypothetical protein